MVECSITGEHLIDELDRLATERGTYPTVLPRDNGPELACSAMADWAAGQVGLHWIPPGELTTIHELLIPLDDNRLG